MFKACMKNYFHNLKYVFTVLGVMFLAFLTGISCFFRQTGLSLKTLGQELADAAGRTDFSLFGAEGGLEQVLENYGNFLGDVSLSIAEGAAGILLAVLVFCLIQAAGLYLSNLIVLFFERRDIRRDGILRILGEQLARGLLICLILALNLWIALKLNAGAGLVLLGLFPLTYCFVALLSAWLTAGKRSRVPRRNYLTFGNMLVLLLSNLLQLGLTLLLALLALRLFSSAAGAVLCAALVVLAASTANLNAYAMLYTGRKTGAQDAAEA